MALIKLTRAEVEELKADYEKVQPYMVWWNYMLTLNPWLIPFFSNFA